MSGRRNGGAGGGGGWFLIRPPCAPSPHPPTLLLLSTPLLFFSSVLSYLRCCVFSLSCLGSWWFYVCCVTKHHSRDICSSPLITPGWRCWQWQGLWPFYMLCLLERHNKYDLIHVSSFWSCFCWNCLMFSTNFLLFVVIIGSLTSKCEIWLKRHIKLHIWLWGSQVQMSSFTLHQLHILSKS